MTPLSAQATYSGKRGHKAMPLMMRHRELCEQESPDSLVSLYINSSQEFGKKILLCSVYHFLVDESQVCVQYQEEQHIAPEFYPMMFHRLGDNVWNFYHSYSCSLGKS